MYYIRYIRNFIMSDKTVDYYLRATWQALARAYNEEAIKHGETISVGFVLLSIDKEGTPSTSLGPKMGIEPTSLTRTLKQMEERGLIYRKKNPNDGRGVLVFLTPLGKEKRDFSKMVVKQFDEVIKDNISEKKLEVFIEVMELIGKLIHERKVFK